MTDWTTVGTQENTDREGPRVVTVLPPDGRWPGEVVSLHTDAGSQGTHTWDSVNREWHVFSKRAYVSLSAAQIKTCRATPVVVCQLVSNGFYRINWVATRFTPGGVLFGSNGVEFFLCSALGFNNLSESLNAAGIDGSGVDYRYANSTPGTSFDFGEAVVFKNQGSLEATNGNGTMTLIVSYELLRFR